MKYRTYPTVDVAAEKHQKYGTLFSVLFSYIPLFVYDSYILSMVTSILYQNSKPNGFGDVHGMIEVWITAEKCSIYYRHEPIGDEPTEAMYQLIQQFTSIRRDYKYFLTRQETGYYYPFKESYFQYKIRPGIIIELPNTDSEAVNAFTHEVRELTYEELDEIVKDLEFMLEGNINAHRRMLNKYHQSCNHPLFISMIAGQTVTRLREATHDGAGELDERIAWEISTSQVYQLFKDYRDCMYEYTHNLPIHWRKSQPFPPEED